LSSMLNGALQSLGIIKSEGAIIAEMGGMPSDAGVGSWEAGPSGVRILALFAVFIGAVWRIRNEQPAAPPGPTASVQPSGWPLETPRSGRKSARGVGPSPTPRRSKGSAAPLSSARGGGTPSCASQGGASAASALRTPLLNLSVLKSAVAVLYASRAGQFHLGVLAQLSQRYKVSFAVREVDGQAGSATDVEVVPEVRALTSGPTVAICRKAIPAAVPLLNFVHPDSATYVVASPDDEDAGVLQGCDFAVYPTLELGSLPALISVVLMDRSSKTARGSSSRAVEGTPETPHATP
jgi:hypothetical protein